MQEDAEKERGGENDKVTALISYKCQAILTSRTNRRLAFLCKMRV